MYVLLLQIVTYELIRDDMCVVVTVDAVSCLVTYLYYDYEEYLHEEILPSIMFIGGSVG